MGNRTYLSIGTRCELEANNCLPVTWLALFAPEEFLVEVRRFDYEKAEYEGPEARPFRRFVAVVTRVFQLGGAKGTVESNDAPAPSQDSQYEDCEVAVYQTSHSAALERVELAIDRLKGYDSVWAFLRPLEILRDELKHCSQEETIELDVTQLWLMNETFEQGVAQGAAAFTRMLHSLTG